MDITTYLTPIAAISGVILSLFSILYTKQQNNRRLDVNLKFNAPNFIITEEPSEIFLELSAFNSGFRFVAIIDYEFLVNGEIIEFDINANYPHPIKKNSLILISPTSKDILPHVLKEGEITFTTITAVELARVLKNKRFNKKRLTGKVNISGHYETAHKKIYKSEHIEFNLDEWKDVPLPGY